MPSPPIELVPKKIGNVLELSRESIEDAPVNELDAVGRAMVRGVATKVDAKFFSDDVASATAPAGLRAGTYPGIAGAVTIDTITAGVGAIEAKGGIPGVAFVSAGDLTALRALKDTTGRGLLEPDPTLPGASAIAGARVLVAPLPDGTAVIADARYIVVAVRRDASVDFSTDSAFTRDAVAARVTMRVDWAVADPSALYVIT